MPTKKTVLTPAELIRRGANHRTQRLTYDEFTSMKVAFWDVEASDLKGDAGVLLCGGVKTLGKKGVRVYRIDDDADYREHIWDDSTVASELRDDLEEHDILVAHYGDRYDVPFLNTRLIGNRLRMLDSSRMAFVDTWLNIRKRFVLHSNRLASLIAHLDTKVTKTELNLNTWIKADHGHTPSLNEVVRHNKHDVEALEEVTMTLVKFYSLRYTYVK